MCEGMNELFVSFRKEMKIQCKLNHKQWLS